jgi:prepilin-type processing-associated H-X9-DG protein
VKCGKREPPGAVLSAVRVNQRGGLARCGSKGSPSTERVNGGGWARPASDFDVKGSTPDGASVPGSVALNCTNGLDVGSRPFPDPVYGVNGTSETYSFHVNGANILMGDGSVRFITAGVDIVTFAALATRAGGEVVGDDW